ncbi:MAG: hypothetical protein GY796_36440, partial [Chloroflexi bacterium]|nr:hypothetical protein [Chloroflexota bacterium]
SYFLPWNHTALVAPLVVAVPADRHRGGQEVARKRRAGWGLSNPSIVQFLADFCQFRGLATFGDFVTLGEGGTTG